MTETELRALERDVEQARGRLLADLDRIRGSGSVSELKSDLATEVRRTKDELVGRVKGAARERADDMLSAVKAKVEANPVAALAIGAGIAWRLYQRPPIATVLIGAGLVSLFKTDPRRPAIGAEAAGRAVRYGAEARDRFEDWRTGDGPPRFGDLAEIAKEDVSEFVEGSVARVKRAAESVRQKVSEAAGGTRERAGELTHDARDLASELADATQERLRQWRSGARGAARRTAAYAGEAADSASSAGRQAIRRVADDGNRDRYLLGAAGLAIAAAVGIAYQRRQEFESRPPSRSGNGEDRKARGTPTRSSPAASKPRRKRPD